MSRPQRRRGEAPPTAPASLLGGYRVLDLADEKGSLCARILADFGADVIKVEPPGGAPERRVGPFYHDVPDPEKSLSWFAWNLNKRGITLNLETGDGRDIFKKLAATSHFLVETLPPGRMESLGLGYGTLREVNPAIIHCSITPFGETGPWRDYRTSDMIACATGGLMYMCGDPDRPPVRVNADVACCEAGAQAAAAVMIAHHFRRLTGRGQHIDVSMQECIAGILYHTQQQWDIGREIVPRMGKFIKGRPINAQTVFPCKDGSISWHILVAYQGDWTRRTVEWMEEEGMASEELRSIEWEKLDYVTRTPEQLLRWEGEFARFFLSKTKAELRAGAAKRNIMLFTCNTMADCLKDEQLAARDFWVPVHHDELGEVLVYPGAPLKLSEAPWRLYRRAPLIGEHNREVFCDELGFSPRELVLMKQHNVI